LYSRQTKQIRIVRESLARTGQKKQLQSGVNYAGGFQTGGIWMGLNLPDFFQADFDTQGRNQALQCSRYSIYLTHPGVFL